SILKFTVIPYTTLFRSKYTSEGIKFLSVENIKTLNSNKFISKEAFEKEFKIRPEFGDVLMTRIGDVGTPNVVETNEYLAYYVSLALLKHHRIPDRKSTRLNSSHVSISYA